MSAALIQMVISDYYAATRKMDVQAWLATMSHDIVAYQPVGTPPLKGYEEMRHFFMSMAAVFETLGLTEEFVHIVDNQVAVKWTGFARGKNGQEVTFEGIDLFEMDAVGVIETISSYWDLAEVMAELQD